MKKILFVHHCSSIGGASWCLFEILKLLDRTRFEPIVLLSADGPLGERIRSLDIPVEVDGGIPTFPFYTHGKLYGLVQLLKALVFYPRGFRVFCEHCRRISPDVLYLNSSAQLFLPWPAKKAGVKKVILHSREHWEFKGFLKIKLYLSRWMIRSFVDHVFSITECGIKAIGFQEKSTVVRDWPSFDDETYLDVRKSLSIESDKFVILLTGGFQAIKGTAELIRAMNYMKHQKRVEVVVLGCQESPESFRKKIQRILSGKQTYAQEVRTLAAGRPNVHLLSPTLQVKAYLSASDVLVAPFVMTHAAKAALEAQLMGVPVVLYDGDPAREYVRNGETGFIVPHGNIEQLALTLDWLMTDGLVTNQQKEAAKLFIKNEFSSDKNIKTIENSFN